MRKLIDALLTTKGVVGFWLVSAGGLYRDNVGCRPWPHPAGRADCGDPARFLLWLAALDPDVVTSRVAIVQPGSALEQTLEGAMDFISLLPLVFLPWILVVLGLAYRSRRPPVEEQARASTPISIGWRI